MLQVSDLDHYVRRAYGSGPDPDFSFVQRALGQQPYAALLRELPVGCTVRDDTDPNDDVSFNYLITCGEQTWRLALSMVGPFALFVRTRRSEPYAQVVDPSSGGVGPREAEILALLRRHSIIGLDAEDIGRAVWRGEAAGDQPPATVYELLFTDSDALPAG